ncbi:S41 family peptidase [Pedobacter aquatilis]|uniref:S41 family peptidase n=1 Tax=Pedobacter aquatilis TaxID=351343 RepID=UPI00292E389C|nr:S41 family peptidase [Pedobacter aquatilis]
MKKLSFIVVISLTFLETRAQQISKAQAIADIDYYNQVLSEVHYNPYLYISKDAYLDFTDKLKSSLPDSVSLKSFVLLMNRLTAEIKDGHTSPSIVQQAFKEDFQKKIYFPFELTTDEKLDIYLPIQPTTSEIPAGAKIISVNGVRLKNFFLDLLGRVDKNQSFRLEMTCGLLGNYLYLANVKPPFDIKYEYRGQTENKTIPYGITLKESLSKALPQVANNKYSFEIKDGKVGHLILNTMESDLNRYTTFFDSCFNLVKTKKLKAVAIDLRKNLGGNSQIADLLISYFNTNPYSLSAGRYWRVSQRYKDYLTAQGDTSNTYLKEANGTVIDRRNCGAHTPLFINNSLLFSGKVYLITGPLTFSSANMLADGVKQYKMAIIIGEPTGENTNDFGEVLRIALPNSKLSIQTTTTFDLGVDCNDQKSQTVKPDILIKTTLKAKIEKTDPVMEYLLKNIN